MGETPRWADHTFDPFAGHHPPSHWQRTAGQLGRHTRVWVAGRMDLFDTAVGAEGARHDLFGSAETAPDVDWLMPTRLPDWVPEYAPVRWLTVGWPPNVWLGTAVAGSDDADARLGAFTGVAGRPRVFVVVDGPCDLTAWVATERIGWVIVRDAEGDWPALSGIVSCCVAADVPLWVDDRDAPPWIAPKQHP